MLSETWSKDVRKLGFIIRTLKNLTRNSMPLLVAKDKVDNQSRRMIKVSKDRIGGIMQLPLRHSRDKG